jgi:hypothetical protein
MKCSGVADKNNIRLGAGQCLNISLQRLYIERGQVKMTQAKNRNQEK